MLIEQPSEASRQQYLHICFNIFSHLASLVQFPMNVSLLGDGERESDFFRCRVDTLGTKRESQQSTDIRPLKSTITGGAHVFERFTDVWGVEVTRCPSVCRFGKDREQN